MPAPKDEAARPASEKVLLRLAVSRGALGLELAEPCAFGPLRIVEFSVTFPGLRYPIDLSGGVSQFRHRRGVLERLAIELQPHTLSVWFAQRLHELIGPLERPPRVSATTERLEFGFNSASAALAFDLVWAPLEGHACFVVEQARGIGLSGPALAYVERALDSTLGHVAKREGRLIRFERGVQRLLQEWLAPEGVRLPGSDSGQFGPPNLGPENSLILSLDAALPPSELSRAALRAVEWARFLREPDELLARGEFEQARILYMRLLDEAPRHPEIVKLIAEIDSLSTVAPNVQLGMLRELGQDLPLLPVTAALLELASEPEAACQAYEAFARSEAFAPLAAFALLTAARSAPDVRAQQAFFDKAVARCPSLASVRWARFEARVVSGKLSAALIDAEQLEHLSQGANERSAVCLKVARDFHAAGRAEEAARFFERSLRYTPEDIEATSGLARALAGVGRHQQAIKLLLRATALSEKRGQPDVGACLDLALLLAEELHDLPQAISRVRQVTHESGRLPQARFLEASWRAELGDLSGASAAFHRFREALELEPQPKQEVVAWLIRAATFAEQQMLDWEAAEGYWALAVRLFPHDTELGALYRHFGKARVNQR